MDLFIQSNLQNKLANYLQQRGYKKITIVNDCNTYKVVAEKLLNNLSNYFEPRNHHYITPPKAQLSKAQSLAKQLKNVDCLIAVGSGTINDITKYAAHLAGVPYISYATALSMNGYASSTASLEYEGIKTSYPATQAKAVFIDLDIVSAAPLELTKAGVGDSLCRSTTQADWLLANQLGLDDEYSSEYFNITLEQQLIDNIDGLLSGDISAYKILAELLVFTGQAMNKAGSSKPASQAEHMLAHLMDSKYGGYHGLQVAVCTLTIAQLQQQLLANDLKPSISRKYAKLDDYFTNEQVEKFKKIYASKPKNIDLNVVDIKAIKAVTLGHSDLLNIYNKLGLPTTSAGLGWDDGFYKAMLDIAKYTRDRFTFLDLH